MDGYLITTKNLIIADELLSSDSDTVVINQIVNESAINIGAYSLDQIQGIMIIGLLFILSVFIVMIIKDNR